MENYSGQNFSSKVLASFAAASRKLRRMYKDKEMKPFLDKIMRQEIHCLFDEEFYKQVKKELRRRGLDEFGQMKDPLKGEKNG